MLKTRIFLFLLLALYGAQHLFAEETERFFDRYNFHFITEKSGLPHCYVEDLIQDSDGYIWAATHYGISRYDGYQLLNYNTGTQPIRLKGDFVHKLCEDNFKRLWIASESGIDIIDLKTYQPVRLRLPADSALSRLMSQYIHTIYKDREGGIWIASTSELWHLEIDETGTVTAYHRLDQSITPASPIHAIADLGWGICAGIDNKIYLLKKDDPTHSLTCRPLSPHLQPFSEDWRISCMQTDGEWLWIGSNRGLFRYNLQTQDLKRYRYSTHRPGMLSQAYITDIKLTGNRHLIVSTLNGLNVYNRKSDTFSFIRQNGYRSNVTINSNAINCLLTTHETIWLGTETGGINLLSPKSLHTELWTCQGPDGNTLKAPVNTFFEDKTGRLWLGVVEKGLVYWDPQTQDYKQYVFSPNDISSISNNTINGILLDSDQQLWIYTWGVGINNLNLRNPNNRHFYRYTREEYPNLKSDFINSACEDTLNNRIWFGSTRGVLYFDKRKNDFGQLFFKETDNDFEAIPKLLIDRKQRLWVGTMQGVFLVDLTSIKSKQQEVKYTYFKYKLNHPESERLEKINCILEDREGCIWLGGNGSGLYKLTDKGDGRYTFVNYTTEHGLSGNTVIGMTEDNNNNLWLMTYEGLTKLDKRTQTFTNYTQADGLPDTQYFYNGIHYSPKHNRIYLATTDGLIMLYQRDADKAPRTSPHVRFSTLTVAGTSPTHPQASIRLHEKDSRFTIGLTTCNYGNNGRIRFAYRLKGYEDEWNETQPGDYTIRYTSVPPGKYTLQARATDESGHWSEQVAEIPVKIVPYFYKSVWFYLPLLLLICIGVWAYYRREIHRYREQRAELKQKVEERTQQLAIRNQQLEEMAEHVREVTEEKITFFTNITHEFRTPVTLIHGPIELALKEANDPHVKEQLEIAKRNSDYLLSLVNELMDFRKLDMDKVTLDKKPCRIAELLQKLLLPFKVFAQERGIDIRAYFRLATPCVMIDVAYMRKAMVNLLANAVKFTPNNGRIDLFVASLQSKDGSPLLYISVCDTGQGILKEDLDKIFERFYQSKNQPSYSGYGQSGTGIGLFLCRKIAELHGGTIYARNNRRHGASFRMLLPLIPAITDESAETPESFGEASASGVSSLPNHMNKQDTILIVEDNKDMRTYIASLLDKDYHVLEVENGKQALEIVQRNDIDLIVSDLMMPVMDGMELSRHIKENLATSHIPFLMLTAIRSDVQEKASLEIGVDEYLCKPFDADTLKLRIHNILALRNKYKQRFSTSTNVKELHIKEESKDQTFINRAIELMEQHYANPDYNLDSFVRDMGYSKTVVNRKMQALTGQPIGQFMKNYRLNIAQKMIVAHASGEISVSEIAYAVGFNDPKYFTKCFKELFGYLPSTLLKK